MTQRLLTLLLVLLAPLSLAAEPQPRLMRAAYEVRWSGATGGVLPEGTIGVVVQSDFALDQQAVHLVDAQGSQVGRLAQEGYLAFVAGADESMIQVEDLILGGHLLGVPLSIQTLVDWAQGKDATGPMAQAQMERDGRNQLTRLQEDGWEVRYHQWTPAQGQLGTPVPQRWEIRHRNGLRLDLTLIEASVFSNQDLPSDYRAMVFMR